MADRDPVEDRVISLVETYGAEAELWPEAERSNVHLALLEAPTPAIEDVLAAARHLDDVLDQLPYPEPAPDLPVRILSNAPRRSLWDSFVGAGLPWPALVPAGGALASLGFGLLIGLSSPEAGTLPTETDEDSILYAALGYSALPDAFGELSND
ncbi:MAG: hypothetical protein AAF253_02915 [Pseudomonadota bacterium]